MNRGQQGLAPARYEIRVQGRLDASWSDWFEGMAFSHGDEGTTILQGMIVDQAALHGLLNGIRDLGLALISVRRVCSTNTLQE